MVVDSIFTKHNILESALQASVLKNEVIQNNIANADVPNFKKKTVVFDKYLSDAVDTSRRTGKLDLSRVKSKVEVVNKNFKYRLDGSNVDMETEMADLYNNSVRFDVMQSSILNDSKVLNIVLGLK